MLIILAQDWRSHLVKLEVLSILSERSYYRPQDLADITNMQINPKQIARNVLFHFFCYDRYMKDTEASWCHFVIFFSFRFANFKLVKSTLKLVKSTLKLAKSTLVSIKSTLKLVKSTLKLVKSTFNVDKINFLMSEKSTLKLVKSTLKLEKSTLMSIKSYQ